MIARCEAERIHTWSGTFLLPKLETTKNGHNGHVPWLDKVWYVFQVHAFISINVTSKTANGSIPS